jgi:hypothetical protein
MTFKNKNLSTVEYLWGCRGFSPLPPQKKNKYLKTSNFKHISNIIILVCLFSKVFKCNENIYIYI